MISSDTVKAIMTDPEFDPSSIIVPALQSYIQCNPSKVLEDPVTVKYLAKDCKGALAIVREMDVNAIGKDGPITMEHIRHILSMNDWRVHRYLGYSLEKLTSRQLDNEFVSAIIESRAIGFIESYQTFINKLDRLNKTKILDKCVSLEDTKLWDRPMWESILDWDHYESIRLLAITLANRKMDITPNKLGRHDSNSIRMIPPNLMEHPEYLGMISDAIRNGYPDEYVCFSCGATTSSPSGYTLHRKKCDQQLRYISPYEMLYGKKRPLDIRCDICNKSFKSRSGLTLHKNKNHPTLC